jgi:hypothetical protein
MRPALPLAEVYGRPVRPYRGGLVRLRVCRVGKRDGEW